MELIDHSHKRNDHRFMSPITDTIEPGAPQLEDEADSDDEDARGEMLRAPSDDGSRNNSKHARMFDSAYSFSWRAFLIRALALLCACSLSIGSHYASYILGPIKSRLAKEMGTSNSEFSLLIAAYSLNSTWTPLVGGLLASRLGTAWSSILATSLIFSGQVILLLGDLAGSVKGMAVGMFIFGLGVSPLAVVQETIIVRFFKSHGLGVSLAMGLVAGKGASFISASTSYPLSSHFGPHAPFVVSTFLTGVSFAINLVYLSSSSWLARGSGIELEAAELDREARRNVTAERFSEAEALQIVAEKKRVRLKDMSKLGDTFWAYIAINVLCGMIWSPFTHLSANIIENRYSLTELQAGQQASLLLAGSIFLYPLCGYITDRVKDGLVVHWLFVASSVLTLLCYLWLSAPPSLTVTPLPAMISFGLGHGFSTLLLVLIVPRLVPLKYVSTALGAHKSIEQSGSTISQTLAGLALDRASWRKQTPAQGRQPNQDAIQLVLNCFLSVNGLQSAGTLLLWRLDFVKRRAAQRRVSIAEYQPVPSASIDEVDFDRTSMEDAEDRSADTKPVEGPRELRRETDEASPLSDQVDDNESAYFDDDCDVRGPTRSDGGSQPHRARPLLANSSKVLRAPYLLSPSRNPSRRHRNHPGLAKGSAEKKRAKIAVWLCAGLVACTWILFMGTAFVELRGHDA